MQLLPQFPRIDASMFGYLRFPSRGSCHSKKRYRQVYASLCSWQRQKYGVRASILISYEAVFLYQLAIDAGIVNSPADNTPTCCKLRNDWSNHWQVNPVAAEFASAFGILLARIKIEDDIRDSGNLMARGSNWFWSKAFRHANQHFDRIDQNLVPEIERLVDQHVDLEQQLFSGSPMDYARPTANAFGLVFSSFAGALSDKSSELAGSQVDRFFEIGRSIGAGILLSDCVFDFQRDQRSKEYNPIQTVNHLPAYQLAALKSFSQAGWDCEDVSTNCNGPVSSQILNFAFSRIEQFSLPLVVTSRPKFRAPRRLHQWSSLRTGDCDIPCDACCDCGGCDGCVGGDCCGSDDGSSFACCYSQSCDLCCCEPTSRKKQLETTPQISIESLKPDSVLDADVIDLRGVADCPLNPTGYILVDGQRYPAKTDGQFIDAGQPISVVSRSTFGFVVELAED